jgi:hypothetical protein
VLEAEVLASEQLERSGSADGVVVGTIASGKAVEIQSAGQQQLQKKGLINSIAQSVPRDWNWSTF